MRKLLLVLAVGAIAAAQSPLSERIAAKIGAGDMKADVSFLASDALQGRGTPSPGLDIAAEYIAAQFRRANLEPAGDDGYFQTAKYERVTPVVEGVELTLEMGGKTLKLDKESFVLSSPAALDLNGRGVKTVIDQATLQALTPEQVKGQVLFVDMTRPAEGVRPVPAGLESGIPAPMLTYLQPGLIVYVRAAGTRAMNLRGRMREVTAAPAASAVPALTIWDEGIRTVVAAAQMGPLEGAVSVHIPAPKIEPMKLRNVVGAIRGSDPVLKDTYVIVTAHYDHLGTQAGDDPVYNGANDNASGTSCVIQIANALAALPERPKRTLVFIALFGEESGLMGSRYYGRNPIFPLAKTVADINLEQMGRTDETSGPRVGQVNATGFDFTTLTAVLAKAGEDFGIKLVKDEKNSDPFFSRSDNQAFADAGIPSHTLSVTYMFPDYHRAGDEWQKLDYDNMAKVARTVALGIYRVADSVEAPQWKAENPATARYVKAQQALVAK